MPVSHAAAGAVDVEGNIRIGAFIPETAAGLLRGWLRRYQFRRPEKRYGPFQQAGVDIKRAFAVGLFDNRGYQAHIVHSFVRFVLKARASQAIPSKHMHDARIIRQACAGGGGAVIRGFDLASASSSVTLALSHRRSRALFMQARCLEEIQLLGAEAPAQLLHRLVHGGGVVPAAC